MTADAQQARRPLPDIRGAARKYWTAGLSGALLLPKCGACGAVFWYPRTHCPECGSDDLDWIQSTGDGEIHTFTIVRNSRQPFFKAQLPYVVAMIELVEGPRLMSNVVGCDLESVHCGMPVKVFFEEHEGVAIPMFRPAEARHPRENQ